MPSSSPRQPAWSTASAGVRPFTRASAIGRQSATIASIGSPGSSVQSAVALLPALARHRAVDVRRVPLAGSSRAASGSAPSSAHTSRRFSSTRSASSPVMQAEVERLVRALADAARRVVNDDLVRAGNVPAEELRGVDQLPRGGELGLAPVELAVQLAAAQLARISPTRGDSPSAELGEVGAADLQAHVAQAVGSSRAAARGRRARARRAARRARTARRAATTSAARGAVREPLDELRARP